MARPSQLPDKLFFRIGEVAEIVGVRAHVLRYWEDEFGILKPMKTRGAHRQYRRRDVELALIIRKLLHEDGFTVAGARKKLRDMGHLGARTETSASVSREVALRAELIALRAELVALLPIIDKVREVRPRVSLGTADPEHLAASTRISLLENDHE